MNYIKLSLKFHAAPYAEILEAELSDLPFDSFELSEKELHAFIPQKLYDAKAIEGILQAYTEQIEHQSTEEVAHQNWNSLWESNYQPVWIGDQIYIRAPFHPEQPEAPFTITLEPNMSFGTGHHPTTALMLGAMMSLPLGGASFFDFGCGSGILSIYACYMGAAGLAVEIDPHAADAARENLLRNNANNVEVRSGGLEQIKATTFDFIAANINRNVIEESSERLYQLINPGGIMLCSGFYTSDAESLIKHLEQQGFSAALTESKDDWALIKAKRTA